MISRPKYARLLEDLEQDLAREHVDAHRRDERLVRGHAASRRAARNAAAHRRQPGGIGLLFEAGDAALVVEEENPHLCRVGGRDGLRRDRDVGPAFDVRLDHLAEVHAVQVIAGEDQVIVCFVPREMAGRLPDRVRRPLEPVAALGRLFGGEHFDEAIREHVHPVGLRHVPVERRRIELREHEDPLEARVHAVADRDVDEPVLAAERHRGLRAHPGERKEAGTASAAEDEREHVVHTATFYRARSTRPRHRRARSPPRTQRPRNALWQIAERFQRMRRLTLGIAGSCGRGLIATRVQSGTACGVVRRGRGTQRYMGDVSATGM